LEAVDRPTFTYSLNQGEVIRVCLWINDQEVKLMKRRNVHRLLRVLCTRPNEQFVGRELERMEGISNVAQTVSFIRQGLDNTFAGSSSWLMTDPIGWAEDRTPVVRVERSCQRPG
jgi:hypothetical protein